MPAEVVKNTMQGKRYDLAIDKVAEQVVRSYGIKISRQAKLLAPIDTGRLKGSITYQTQHFHGARNSPATAGDLIDKPTDDKTCLVGTNVDYAIGIEYGTGKQMSGQPFLRPAFDIVKKGATAESALEIRKAMKEENAKRFG